MSDNGVAILDWFLAWMRDCFRGMLLYFLQKIDNTRYIPEPTQAITSDLSEETSEDVFQVYEVDNVDDSFIGESNIELIEEPIDGENHQPEPSITDAHNALLRHREYSLMQLLSNTTDDSFQLIMTPGTDSIDYRP